MLFNFDSSGGPMSQDMVSFTGDWVWFQDEETGDWEICIFSSGTLRFLTSPGQVDVCALGPGENGAAGSSSGANDVTGGSGGRGGEMVTDQLRPSRGVSYPVSIGDPGGLTAGLGVTARGGSRDDQVGAVQGVGGHVLNNAQQRTQPSGGNQGALAYSNSGVQNLPTDTDIDTEAHPLKGKLLGASGGGGRATAIYNNQYYPTSGGSVAGGSNGGGNGGGAGSAGSAGTLPGAGGGGGGVLGESAGGGGAGAKGALFIRNHREAAA